MSTRMDYSKIQDRRKVYVGGAVLGGFVSNKITNIHDELKELTQPKTQKKPLSGIKRRNQEISALQSVKNRTENQEKRLQCLLKLNNQNKKYYPNITLK